MQLLVGPRETVSIDGVWQAIPDQYEQHDGYDEDYFDDLDQPDIEMMHRSIYEPEASTDAT